MKRLVVLMALCVSMLSVMAQYSQVNIASRHGELFYVYVDGILQNTRPMRSVSIQTVPDGMHDLEIAMYGDEEPTIYQKVNWHGVYNYVIQDYGVGPFAIVAATAAIASTNVFHFYKRPNPPRRPHYAPYTRPNDRPLPHHPGPKVGHHEPAHHEPPHHDSHHAQPAQPAPQKPAPANGGNRNQPTHHRRNTL